MPTDTIMWTPTSNGSQHTHLRRFMEATGFADAPYEALHRWSVAQPAEFWSAVWRYAGLVGDRGERAFVRSVDKPMTGSRFYPDASVNLA